MTTGDSNRSRWPLHPLWVDLLAQIETFDCQGVYREIDAQAALNERLMRIAVSVYGLSQANSGDHWRAEGLDFVELARRFSGWSG